MFRRSRQGRDLEGLIDEIFLREQIKEYRLISRDVFHLFELLCEANKISQIKAYRYFASIVGVPFVSKLRLPCREVFQKTSNDFNFGFSRSKNLDFSFLKKNYAFPQKAANGSIFLVSANPGTLVKFLTSLQLDSLKVSGHLEIRKAWSVYDEIYQSKISSIYEISLRMIQHLSLQAYANEAEEVFIIEGRYEYFVGTKWYSGEITNEVFTFLWEKLALNTQCFFSFLDGSIRELPILIKAGQSSHQRIIIIELPNRAGKL